MLEKNVKWGGGYLLPSPPIIYTKFSSRYLGVRYYLDTLFDHMNSTAFYVLLICEALNLDKEETGLYVTGALLHDVGKIKIKKEILVKSEPLNDLEWMEIKKHPLYGVGVVCEDYGVTEGVIPIIKYHHERYDGNGYYKVDQKAVPLGAKIVSIADAFDAMYSVRPYRNPMSFVSIIQEINRCSGTQFDPSIVKIVYDYYGFLDGKKANAESIKQIIERGERWLNQLLEWDVPYLYIQSFNALLDKFINEWYIIGLLPEYPGQK
ncbi:HD-GYP domain-containing protein [Caldanaerobius polysaccharolyticus]|uniref:HD-GYP domain-containing protein n=1 Tax=Caldanaerobius polysaccharolyticus TaxID=44256 RepID=UPI00068CCEE7|nr:HD domain-containing phosphohydrolase [Caldanaerobius polysaccharolyticus]